MALACKACHMSMWRNLPYCVAAIHSLLVQTVCWLPAAALFLLLVQRCVLRLLHTA